MKKICDLLSDILLYALSNGVSPKVHLFYVIRQCNALNNPYWHEKGLAAMLALQQTELMPMQSIEFIDNYIEGIMLVTLPQAA